MTYFGPALAIPVALSQSFIPAATSGAIEVEEVNQEGVAEDVSEATESVSGATGTLDSSCARDEATHLADLLEASVALRGERAAQAAWLVAELGHLAEGMLTVCWAETGTLLVEWILEGRRLGFGIEPNPRESNWFLIDLRTDTPTVERGMLGDSEVGPLISKLRE